VQYNVDMFPEKAIARILKYLELACDKWTSEPNSRLSDLRVTVETEAIEEDSSGELADRR